MAISEYASTVTAGKSPLMEYLAFVAVPIQGAASFYTIFLDGSV
jgi:hypothetical protein